MASASSKAQQQSPLDEILVLVPVRLGPKLPYQEKYFEGNLLSKRG